MIAKDYKTNTNVIYTLRIDVEIFEKIKQAATENRRSIAKEIEHRLAKSL